MKSPPPFLAFFFAILLIAPLQESAAHIAYRDIQLLGTPTNNPDGSTTYSSTYFTPGNGAWANATDADWGNSHDVPWYKFTISNPNGAIVDVAMAGGITRVGNLNTLGDLTPGISLYSGLLPNLAHDGATCVGCPDLTGKDGGWLALADTTLANDAGQVSTIHYLGHAGEVNNGAQSVSLTQLFLGPGSYTLAMGGTCYECYPHYERIDPNNPAFDPTYEAGIAAIETDAQQNRGFSLGVTIHPVPLPPAIWFVASGVIGLATIRKRGTV